MVLDDLLSLLSTQKAAVQLTAAGLFLQSAYYFCAIRAVFGNRSLLRGVLEEARLLLVEGLPKDGGSMQPEDWDLAAESWRWADADRQLFTRQFSALKVVQHYRGLRDQLAALGRQGGIALARVEREVVLKVVSDFAEQLGPAEEGEALITQADVAAELMEEVGEVPAKRGMKPTKLRRKGAAAAPPSRGREAEEEARVLEGERVKRARIEKAKGRLLEERQQLEKELRALQDQMREELYQRPAQDQDQAGLRELERQLLEQQTELAKREEELRQHEEAERSHRALESGRIQSGVSHHSAAVAAAGSRQPSARPEAAVADQGPGRVLSGSSQHAPAAGSGVLHHTPAVSIEPAPKVDSRATSGASHRTDGGAAAAAVVGVAGPFMDPAERAEYEELLASKARLEAQLAAFKAQQEQEGSASGSLPDEAPSAPPGPVPGETSVDIAADISNVLDSLKAHADEPSAILSPHAAVQPEEHILAPAGGEHIPTESTSMLIDGLLADMAVKTELSEVHQAPPAVTSEASTAAVDGAVAELTAALSQDGSSAGAIDSVLGDLLKGPARDEPAHAQEQAQPPSIDPYLVPQAEEPAPGGISVLDALLGLEPIAPPKAKSPEVVAAKSPEPVPPLEARQPSPEQQPQSAAGPAAVAAVEEAPAAAAAGEEAPAAVAAGEEAPALEEEDSSLTAARKRLEEEKRLLQDRIARARQEAAAQERESSARRSAADGAAEPHRSKSARHIVSHLPSSLPWACRRSPPSRCHTAGTNEPAAPAGRGAARTGFPGCRHPRCAVHAHDLGPDVPARLGGKAGRRARRLLPGERAHPGRAGAPEVRSRPGPASPDRLGHHRRGRRGA